MKKPKRPRTERREHERSLRKLVQDKQRLAALEPGGSPERPIAVVSSSVIPVRARSMRCPLCDGAMRFDDETAERVEGRSLRAAHVTCQSCGVARRWWFEIRPPLPS